jgi:hypothetical protein
MPFYFSRKLSSNQGALFSVLALCGITGFAGIMVRSGPESLKPLLYESVIIPIAIVAVGVIITGFLNKIKLRVWKVRK